MIQKTGRDCSFVLQNYICWPSNNNKKLHGNASGLQCSFEWISFYFMNKYSFFRPHFTPAIKLHYILQCSPQIDSVPIREKKLHLRQIWNFNWWCASKESLRVHMVVVLPTICPRNKLQLVQGLTPSSASDSLDRLQHPPTWHWLQENV